MISIPSTVDKIEPTDLDSSIVTIEEASTVTYISPLTMEEINQCKLTTSSIVITLIYSSHGENTGYQ